MSGVLDAAVVLVGGGPCGLMLANELGHRGIRTLLFDEKPGTSPYPQANATQARTMEYFRRLGMAEEVRAQGLPADYPTDVAYFTRYTTHEIARFELPTAARARDLAKHLSGSWSAAELPHRCSQMYIERVMRRHAERHPSVSLNFGWRVTGFTEVGDRLRVEAVNEADGRRVMVTAAYLVGCDGPRSATRKALGFAYQGETAQRDFLGGRMLAMHIRAPVLYQMIAGKPAWSYWAVNRDRRSFLIALDGRSEFIFSTQLKPEEQDRTISADEAREMFFTTLGARCDLEVLTHLSWTAGLTLVAEHFQRGRVFLAGDAVHLFTPTGGLGYNTAVEDAVNLAWKLAATVEGWGGPGLLASYEIERRPLALRNTAYARRFADSIGGFVPPPEIEEDTPVGAAARRAAGEYLNTHARAEFNIPGITFGTRYDGSPLLLAEPASPPPDQANLYVPTAMPGGRPPHAWLAEGRSLYDGFGLGFTLLRLGAAAPDAAPLMRAAAHRNLPLRLLSLPALELRELYGAALVLIRPDQIVAWRAELSPQDCDAVLAVASGHGAPG